MHRSHRQPNSETHQPSGDGVRDHYAHFPEATAASCTQHARAGLPLHYGTALGRAWVICRNTREQLPYHVTDYVTDLGHPRTDRKGKKVLSPDNIRGTNNTSPTASSAVPPTKDVMYRQLSTDTLAAHTASRHLQQFVFTEDKAPTVP